MFYNIKDLSKWENKSTVYSIKLIIFGEHDVRVRIPLKFSIRQNPENGVSEETLNQCGLNGEFYERGIFNGQPVYSNGVTKFVWLPESINRTIYY